MIEKGSINSAAEKMPSSQGCRTSLAIWPRVYHPHPLHPLWDESLAPTRRGKRYNRLSMLIAIFFMRLFEVMFFLGIAGSAVVVAISFVEDLQLLVGE